MTVVDIDVPWNFASEDLAAAEKACPFSKSVPSCALVGLHKVNLLTRVRAFGEL